MSSTALPTTASKTASEENNLTGFTITHDLIRRAVPELARRLATAAADGPPDPAAVRRLVTWWGMFTAILHGHHTSEDSHVWPTVLAADPGLADAARALEQQHGALEEHLAGIDQGLARLQRGSGEPEPERELQTLLARIAAFDALMRDHLLLEEDTMVPVLRAGVTAEGYRGMMAALASGHDPADFVPTMPLLLERAPAAAREFMLGGLPDQLRARYLGEWEPGYRELVASLPPEH